MKQQFNNGGFETRNVQIKDFELCFLEPDTKAKVWTLNLANMFGSMLRDEIRLEVKHPFAWLTLALTFVLDFLAWMFSINKVVFYNHQGFSTNIHTESQIDAFNLARPLLGIRFPKQAIIIRSVCERDLGEFTKKFFKIPTRLIFIHDNPQNDLKSRSNCKKDLRLFERYNLSLRKYTEPFEEHKIQIALRQYRHLYLQKYSKNSPDFSAEYFIDLLNAKVLEFYGIEDRNQNLLAFFALYINGEFATPALIGYDFGSAIPLYRALMVGALDTVSKRGLKLNNSAGSPIFKSRRGGKAQIEYMLIYAEHLGFWRKTGYLIFEKISGLMLPFFRKIAAGEVNSN